jgi:hypothetical protein
MSERWVRVAVAPVIVGMLALAGCAGGPTASVAALETAVLLAAGEAEAKEITKDQKAAQGDVVSTDVGGLAQLEFPDGSSMRLGGDSSATITKLGTKDEQVTTVTLASGSSWHTVEKLTAKDAAYQVVTPVGTASVTGTVFAVECADASSCTFTVLDGEVDVDGVTVGAYQQLVLPAQSAPQTIPVDALSDWVTSNIERDASADDAVALPAPPLAAASVDGEWSGALVTDTTNSTNEPAGFSSPVDWTLSAPVCDPDCTVTVSSTMSGWSVDAPLVDGTMSFTREGEFECVYADTGQKSGEKGSYSYDYVLTIAAADDGGQAATQITGTLSGEETLDTDFTDCDLYTTDGSKTVTYERNLTLSRMP